MIDDKDAYSLAKRTPAIEDYMRLRKISGLIPFSKELRRSG